MIGWLSAVCEGTPLTIPLSFRRSAMSPTCEIIRRPVQVLAVIPRQSNLAFTSIQLSGMNLSQRAQALSCLANLLMLAAGGADQEDSDEQR
jgi:hypothetical protein